MIFFDEERRRETEGEFEAKIAKENAKKDDRLFSILRLSRDRMARIRYVFLYHDFKFVDENFEIKK